MLNGLSNLSTRLERPGNSMATDNSGDRIQWRTRAALYAQDHGFLRVFWRNRHRVGGDMWRSNQPSPSHIAAEARLGTKTIINLRGESDAAHYRLEKAACAEHGIAFMTFRLFSRDMPSQEAILGARDLFAQIAYPALMHCKSGADRAGIGAVLFRIFRCGDTMAQARAQLSFRYGHIKYGKTGMLDAFCDAYELAYAASGISFVDWVETQYEPARLKAQFQDNFWANIWLDRILRRE